MLAGRPHVVLAHDWLAGLRGGEHVLDAIAVALRHAGADVSTLLTMFDDGRPLTPAIDALPRVVSPLGRLGGFSRRARRHLLPLYPWAVSRLSSSLRSIHASRPVDLVVSTSSAAIKGLRTPEGVPHLCYVHSPPRYLWSQGEAYGRSSVLTRLGLAASGPWLRRWDAATASRPTTLLANSAHTAALIRKVWHRESQVLHPPVRTDFFGATPPVARDGSWLVVSALEPYKRVDLAIEASQLAGVRLVIVGDGSLASTLRSEAPATVEFKGRVDDATLRDLYARASVLIHPQIEDFGIVAVEAQAAGLPVVALASGGAVETVVDGVTGAFFREQAAAAIVEAARRVQPQCDPACREWARRFSHDRFETAFLAAAAQTLGRHDR
jgi:glycosyltransferase involved in cell wall biosynthesis